MDQNLVNKLTPQNWPKILGDGWGKIYIFFNQVTRSRLWKRWILRIFRNLPFFSIFMSNVAGMKPLSQGRLRPTYLRTNISDRLL